MWKVFGTFDKFYNHFTKKEILRYQPMGLAHSCILSMRKPWRLCSSGLFPPFHKGLGLWSSSRALLWGRASAFMARGSSIAGLHFCLNRLTQTTFLSKYYVTYTKLGFNMYLIKLRKVRWERLPYTYNLCNVKILFRYELNYL